MNLRLQKTPQLNQTMKGRSVLLVDDEPLIRDLCAQVLTDYRILEAGNGEEALQLLERESVDVILSDVMMPKLNGLDLLCAVKERTPNQVVVIMTGYAEKELILKALKSDADDFITKPINLLQLRTTIDRVLEKKLLKEELIQLKKMDRLKSDFLGLISHKLKTPVTSISLFMQHLKGGIDDPDDPEFQRTLQLILDEASYLGYLIQDLLHYSEIILQEDKLNLETVETTTLLQELVDGIGDEAHRKGVRIEQHFEEGLPELQVDLQRITFALRALIDNAIKFSPEKSGTVTLAARKSDDGVRIEIEDNGTGIAKEELPKIFEKFYQVDPDRTGQMRGFGLGLFYTRQFIQEHGGRLKIDSEVGRGTRVTVILPQ